MITNKISFKELLRKSKNNSKSESISSDSSTKRKTTKEINRKSIKLDSNLSELSLKYNNLLFNITHSYIQKLKNYCKNKQVYAALDQICVEFVEGGSQYLNKDETKRENILYNLLNKENTDNRNKLEYYKKLEKEYKRIDSEIRESLSEPKETKINIRKESFGETIDYERELNDLNAFCDSINKINEYISQFNNDFDQVFLFYNSQHKLSLITAYKSKIGVKTDLF